MKKIKAIWELMRLEHGIMLFLAILIGSIISQKTIHNNFDLSLINIFLTFFTALFLEASTFALNDYYDLEIDRINNRTDRPLVRGDISPNTALYIFVLLFPIGLICSYFVNITCFVIALITALLSVLYDAKIKKIKLIGNFYIAYIMAIPFIFGGATALEKTAFAFEQINPAIYVIAVIAFLAGSGREIMKDVMDFEGDKKSGVKSFPKYIGARKSNIIAGVFFMLAIFFSFFPFCFESFDFYYLNFYYLFIVLFCDSMLISVSFLLIIKKNPPLKFYRKFSFYAIFIGLIAFLIPILLLIFIGGI